MCIYCINSTYILYRSVCPLVVQTYTIQDEVNPQNLWKYTVASGNFVFVLRYVFQECNPGIKRDLPVCMYIALAA